MGVNLRVSLPVHLVVDVIPTSVGVNRVLTCTMNSINWVIPTHVGVNRLACGQPERVVLVIPTHVGVARLPGLASTGNKARFPHIRGGGPVSSRSV